jgi:hypothetical protein
MLFGSGSASLSGLFATHPPLTERIRRIDPSFDPAQLKQARSSPGFSPQAESAVQEFAAGTPPRTAASAPQTMAVDAAALHGSIGNPGAEHVGYAARILKGIPASLREATHRPGPAACLVLGLMLGEKNQDRAVQLKLVERGLGREASEAADRLGREARELGGAYRLPLVDLAFGSLRHLAPEQVGRLQHLLQELAANDGRLEFFEFILARMVQTHLVDRLQPSRGDGNAGLGARKPEALTLLAALASAGDPDPKQAAAALQAGAAAAGIDASGTAPRLDLLKLDGALVQLDDLRPRDKARLVTGLVTTVAFDGRVTVEESEMLRAVCDTLHVPVPPLGAPDQAPRE